MKNSKLIGNKGEGLVTNWLEELGYTVLERNYYSRYGEIDIIAKKNEFIAFVEVKTRKNNSMIAGVWDITKNKQLKIIKTAVLYLQEKNLDLQPRFDVCIVINSKNNQTEIDYFENAFDGNIF